MGFVCCYRWIRTFKSCSINEKNAVFNTDHIDLSTDSTFQYAIVNTKNKINCSNYNYINIYYSMSQAYNPRIVFANKIDSGLYGIGGESIDWNERLNSEGEMVVSIPITSENSEYVIINTLRGISSDSLTDLKVYGVYLSTKIDP